MHVHVAVATRFPLALRISQSTKSPAGPFQDLGVCRDEPVFDWPDEVHLHFNGRKIFVFQQSSPKSNSHGCVCQSGDDATMYPVHRVVKVRAAIEFNTRFTDVTRLNLETETGNGSQKNGQVNRSTQSSERVEWLQ